MKRARAERAEKLKQLKTEAARAAKEKAMKWVAERDTKRLKAEEAIRLNKEKIMTLTRVRGHSADTRGGDNSAYTSLPYNREGLAPVVSPNRSISERLAF